MIFSNVLIAFSINYLNISSTHRWCYGSELIKDYPNYTKWTCQKCDFIMKNPHIFDQINCIFCPFKVGINIIIKE